MINVKKIFDKIKTGLPGWPLMPVLLYFLLVLPARAQEATVTSSVGRWIIDATIGNVASLLAWLGGWIVTKVIDAVIIAAQYSNFIDNPAIIEGWIVIRDLCNMFFILVLLLIAFATILQLENYSMKRWLPKLILMAVLINFSRMIVGLLIDASQVVMLTFVSAFAGGGGNFYEYMQIGNFLRFTENSSAGAVNLTSAVAAYVLSVVFIIIAIVAFLAILLVFVMRIVMLWIYVVLSPLGFFLMAFPGGARYASKYWGELTKYLLNGPVLAFFIWLALATISSLDTAGNMDFVGSLTSGAGAPGQPAILDSGNFIRFILALAFLAGGLMTSSEIGGAGASWGASKVNQLKAKGVSMARGAANRGLRKASDVSGLSAARQYLSERKSMKESARSEKISMQASKLAWGVSGVKQGIARGFERTGGAMLDKVTGKTKADKARKEMIISRQAFENIKEGLKGRKYTEREKDEFDLQAKEADLPSTFNAEQDKKARQYISSYGRKDGMALINHEVKAQEAETRMKKAENWMKVKEKAVKLGLGVAGGVAGGALFGPAGAVGGLMGGEALINKFRNAGSIDAKLAGNFRAKQISDKTKDVQDVDYGTRMDIYNDKSKDIYLRAAAAKVMMEKGEMDLDGAIDFREWLKENMGGKDQNEGFRDKKVGSMFEGVALAHNQAASELWRTAKEEPAKLMERKGLSSLSEAQHVIDTKNREMREAISSGVFSMRNMDGGSLAASIDNLAKALKPGTFVKQFGDLDDARRGQLIDALKVSGEAQARKMLAFLTDARTAFKENNAEAMDFLKNLSSDDFRKIINEDKDGSKIRAIKSYNPKFEDFSNSVHTNATTARALRKILGLPADRSDGPSDEG